MQWLLYRVISVGMAAGTAVSLTPSSPGWCWLGSWFSDDLVEAVKMEIVSDLLPLSKFLESSLLFSLAYQCMEKIFLSRWSLLEN